MSYSIFFSWHPYLCGNGRWPFLVLNFLPIINECFIAFVNINATHVCNYFCFHILFGHKQSHSAVSKLTKKPVSQSIGQQTHKGNMSVLFAFFLSRMSNSQLTMVQQNIYIFTDIHTCAFMRVCGNVSGCWQANYFSIIREMSYKQIAIP